MSPTNDQRSPQPSLTERRKAATQLDIARAAAELFAEHGPDGTTAEDIAHRAGVALRTFYRYFRGKQDAVGPLLAAGGDAWRALLADAEPGADLRLTLETAVTATLSAPGDHGPEQLETTRGLLRAAQDDAALRAVWYRVNQESEERLVPVLARLAGERADPRRTARRRRGHRRHPDRPGGLGRHRRTRDGRDRLTGGPRAPLPARTDGRDQPVGGRSGRRPPVTVSRPTGRSPARTRAASDRPVPSPRTAPRPATARPSAPPDRPRRTG